MSLYAELKRRNVIRVGAAYVVTAWLLIQVAETIFPLFGFGDTPARLVVIILAIGFIPAMVIAWVFELTPQGLKRDVDVDSDPSIIRSSGNRLDRIILVMLAAALAYFAFDKFVLDPAQDRRIAETARQEGVEQARIEARLDMISDKSVAVLPFVNRSMQEEDQYFTDGIHDELLTQLSRISALKVISRTSVEKYRDTDKSLPEMARDLGVATIVEGAVQRVGNQVRINAQLINAHTDEHLWADTFDRAYTLDNLLAIQSEVTASIAEALEAELTEKEKGRIDTPSTSSLEAYDLYLLGRQLRAKRRLESTKQALAAFEQAVEIDPEFAKAWVEIAFCYHGISGSGTISEAEALAKRNAAVEKTLALDDQLGEAYAALSFTLRGEERQAALRKAIELNPNYSEAYMWLAQVTEDQPPYEKILSLYYKAAELDPLLHVVQINIAFMLSITGRVEEGMERLRHVLRNDPEFTPALGNIGSMLALNGQLAESMVNLRKAEQLDPANIRTSWGIAEVYMAMDDWEAVAEVGDRIGERREHQTDAAVVEYLIKMNVKLAQEGWRESLMLDSIPGEAEIRGEAMLKIHRQRALAYLVGEDYRSALAQYLAEDQRWADPEQWPELIGDVPAVEMFGSCVVADLLIRTGQDDLGEALMQQGLEHHLEIMPGLYEATDRYCFFIPGLCHLVSGDHDQALDFFERQIALGHYLDWYWIRRLPWWNLLRDDPRYIALEETVDRKAAEQRELLRQMDEAGEQP
jgi:TolB-like protein/Tfp pilus assembly protein PilF